MEYDYEQADDMKQDENSNMAEPTKDHVPIRSTKDLGFAAFCRMRKLVLRSAKRVNRKVFEFNFEDPHDRWGDLKLEFSNSESADFDASMRHLKKMLNN